MKFSISHAAFFLVSSTNAQIVDRALKYWNPDSPSNNNVHSSYRHAAPAAATCDSTLGHCGEEICDIVSDYCAVGGPVGPAGPKGQPGQRGPAGLNGKDGKDGKQGPMGPPGAQGARGEKGATGAPGAQGQQGATGPQGPPGKNGLDGLPGAPGADGPIGPDGPKGDKGEKGEMGMQGPQGPAGADAAPLEVNHACITESSQPVTMKSCNHGLDGDAVATCPQGYELTSCSGVSQDGSSPLATSCYVEGNQCICDGCNLSGDKNSYHYPELIAQARCCLVFAGEAGAQADGPL